MARGGKRFGYGLGAGVALAGWLALAAAAAAEVDSAEAPAPAGIMIPSLHDEAQRQLADRLALMTAAAASPTLARAQEGIVRDAPRLIRESGHAWTSGAVRLDWSHKPRDGGVYVHGQKVRYLQRF